MVFNKKHLWWIIPLVIILIIGGLAFFVNIEPLSVEASACVDVVSVCSESCVSGEANCNELCTIDNIDLSCQNDCAEGFSDCIRSSSFQACSFAFFCNE